MEQSNHLSPAATAHRLGISKRTLYRMARTGDGPPYIQVTARRRRYPESWLQEWETASRRGK